MVSPVPLVLLALGLSKLDSGFWLQEGTRGSPAMLFPRSTPLLGCSVCPALFASSFHSFVLLYLSSLLKCQPLPVTATSKAISQTMERRLRGLRALGWP